MLIVEDQPLMLELESIVLSEQGYTVLEASNGLEALRLAQAHSGQGIHLLLTDVEMPFMSGEDLASRLMEIHRDLKVIYASGHGLESLLDAGVLRKPVNFIPKPFTLPELISKVREVLDNP